MIDRELSLKVINQHRQYLDYARKKFELVDMYFNQAEKMKINEEEKLVYVLSSMVLNQIEIENQFFK